jgi:perosamine synthetase
MAELKQEINLQAILEAVKGCLPKDRSRYGLHEPNFTGNEWKYVKDCLDSGWVSSVGKYVSEYEQKISDYTQIPHTVAVVNGTAALHLALKICGVENHDEVLLPTLTFVATANAVAYCGATPHFVDSSLETLGVDPIKLEAYLRESTIKKGSETFNKTTGRRIKALIVMHTFGHSVDLDPVAEICKSYHIDLIEDAAEALGSFYKGKHVGDKGRLTILSFNGNKIITTGGGGAILTSDKSLAEKAKHLSTTAKVPHVWNIEHDEIGYNYRLPNLNAALGLAQIESLDEKLSQKRELAERYKHAIQNLTGVRFFDEPPFARSNFWLNVILLEPEYKSQRGPLLKLLHENGIQSRPAWTLMHKLPMFLNSPKMNLEVAEDIEERLLNLPSSPFLL